MTPELAKRQRVSSLTDLVGSNGQRLRRQRMGETRKYAPDPPPPIGWVHEIRGEYAAIVASGLLRIESERGR